MKNLFEESSDEQLVEAYKDYLGSKVIGISVSSFKPFAEQIKNELEIELWNCFKLVEQMFFEEVAKRYCNMIDIREV